jgi:hypothetical protein
MIETERQLRHDNEVLKAKNFSLIKEMSDLEAQKHGLIEYCNRRKEELEELLEEQQQIQNMMTKHQLTIIGMIVGAYYFVFKLFETRLTKAIEILEMHEGDIV